MKLMSIIIVICLISLTACGVNSIADLNDGNKQYKGQVLVPLPPYVIADEKKGN
jgi:hypothetical protein